MPYEYSVNGRVVTLPVNPDKIGVRFHEPSDSPQRRAAIDPRPEVGSFDNRIELPGERFTIVDVARDEQLGRDRVTAAAEALNADSAVERVAPVFDLGDRQALATDRILLGFKPEADERAKELIKDYGGEVLEEHGDEYLVRLQPSVDPFDVIGSLTKHAEVDYAEPDFVTIGKHTRRPPDPDGSSGGASVMTSGEDDGSQNPAWYARDESEAALAETIFHSSMVGPDPLQNHQYALRITQAVEAWQLVDALAEIKISILDEGVDITHPDLKTAILDTFDAVDGDTDQQPNPWDAHGTACAGLAAALGNNALGIRGIGSGCSLLAARIAYSPTPDSDWITTNSGVRAAIDWAWQSGADVLSNSWGGGAPSNAIINAFERARTQGRNGKGCVVVVAAGNENGPVSFPGDLPNILTVSASNEDDKPKTCTSSDGEFWWGSNFGPEVDVAAPGVHNYTTDIVGAGGYNEGPALDADYVANFNGASSATPIVAGVAGLVLSVNPNLREAQVRRIIKQTADKVGQVVYTNGRNDRMGHGRVNALRAVERASALR